MFTFLNSFLAGIPNILWAIILLVIAFIAAVIVQSLVTRLLQKFNAEKCLGKLGVKDADTKSSVVFVAKLAYFITFLLFLPAVLDKLGMQSVSSPIMSMVNTFLAFIPKLVGAGIIIAVGMFLGKLIKQLLIPILKAIKIDSLQEKAGIETSDSTALSSILANIAYAIIILVAITAALEQLGIAAISDPANDIVSSIFAMIPNVLGAIVIVAIGVFISRLVSKLLENVLAGVGADNLVSKITGNPEKKVSLSRILSEVVKYVLIVIFLVQGINILNLPVLTQIGAAIIGYMPAVLSAVIIIAIGIFAANTAEAALVKKFPSAKASALVTKIAIYALTAVMCFSQLNVAAKIVETTFLLIIAALCVAFAIAFGIGGRKFAADTMEKLEQKMKENQK
ncbi:MAG: mechanosensitive ion channel [Eubacteriales bacterium]|nr:mechanosensitive ion channel [Eubacteriales bacterium]